MSLDKRGLVSFQAQIDAEAYLKALPRGYDGVCFRSTEPHKWLVHYKICEHLTIDREGFCVRCREYSPQCKEIMEGNRE